MKRILILLLIVVLTTCTVACKEGGKSNLESIPITDATTNSEISTDTVTKNDDQQQESKEDSSDRTISVAESANESSSKLQKKDETTNNANQTYGDIEVEYPRFTAKSDLNNWLRNKDATYFQSGREELTNILQSGSAIQYFEPSIPSDHGLFTLDEIEAHTPSGDFNYFYNVNNEQSELVVMVSTKKHSGTEYEVFSNLYLKQDEDIYRAEIEGIVFYYEHVSGVDDVTRIAWRQFGLDHLASLRGHYDQLDQILPLLKLEQVTVNLNTDHVTE